MEKKPVSQARIDANRANAKKSTGPRTAAGKARSSANAVRNGYSSKNFVLGVEDVEEYYRVRDRYMRRFNARDEVEMNLIDMMAHASWNIHRTWSSQNALVDAQMFRMRGALEQQYSQVPPDSAVAFAVEDLAKQPGLSFLNRYEHGQLAQLQRALRIFLEIREKVPLPPSNGNHPELVSDTNEDVLEANPTQPETNPISEPCEQRNPLETNATADRAENRNALETNPTPPGQSGTRTQKTSPTPPVDPAFGELTPNLHELCIKRNRNAGADSFEASSGTLPNEFQNEPNRAVATGSTNLRI